MRFIICLLFFNVSLAHAQGKSSSGPVSAVTLTPNIPHIYDITYEKINRAGHFSFAAGAGLLPSITVSSVKLSAYNFDVRARWHPFGGAFFLGLATGYHNYHAVITQSTTISGQTVPYTVDDVLSGMFITPHLGWLAMFGKFIVGLEIGSQSGVGSSNAITPSISDATLQSYLTQLQASAAYTSATDKVNKSITSLTNLPYIGFKLGWSL